MLAAIVAVGLSGLPALTVEHGEDARIARHRCHCPPGQHACECATCNAAARKARRAGAERLPSCCRSRALQALAREEADQRKAAPAGAPCLRASCERSDELLPTVDGRELVVLPAPALLPARGWASAVPVEPGRPLSRPVQPELPPPRRA
jgi:hypothetical protein